MNPETKQQREAWTCPVCHQDQPKGPALYVGTEAGDAYLCSERCAKIFDLHCQMPVPRPPLP